MLLIVIGSTRPGRVGEGVARWVERRAREDGRFVVRVADLAKIDLPLLDESDHPRRRNYVHEHTRRWSEIVEAADAVVLATPEYNNGPGAAAKNAVDCLHHEWSYKPIGFVGYGGVSGGSRAVLAMRSFVIPARAVPVADAVLLPFIATMVDDAGAFRADARAEAACRAMLDELDAVGSVLRPLRGRRLTAQT